MAFEDSQLSGLAGRYASAAFELALEERALDALAADMAALKGLLSASPELARLVRSPVFSREEQSAGLEAVLKQAKAAPLTRKLVLLLAQKRRLFILADVIRTFEALLARHRGEVAAGVVSARELSAEETAELKRILRDKLGREPKLETRVDPHLLGGLVLRVGSRMIDTSLRTKLEGLRANGSLPSRGQGNSTSFFQRLTTIAHPQVNRSRKSFLEWMVRFILLSI